MRDTYHTTNQETRSNSEVQCSIKQTNWFESVEIVMDVLFLINFGKSLMLKIAKGLDN